MHRRLVAIALVALPLAVTHCTIKGKLKSSGRARGWLRASGKPAGPLNLQIARCRSGEAWYFYGAWLMPEGSETGALKLVKDPLRGKVLQVERPCKRGEECTMLTIDRKACKTYVVKLKQQFHTFSRSRHITRYVDGRVKLDCSFEGGGTLTADITFERCGF